MGKLETGTARSRTTKTWLARMPGVAFSVAPRDCITGAQGNTALSMANLLGMLRRRTAMDGQEASGTSTKETRPTPADESLK